MKPEEATDLVGKTIQVDWAVNVNGNKFKGVPLYTGKVVEMRDLAPGECCVIIEGSPHTPIRVERVKLCEN